MTTPYDYADQNFDRFRQELIDLLRIPSVSTDPAFAPDVQRAANWLAEHMRVIGLENIAVMPTDGHPVVYGDWLHAGDDAPTILIYGHYDVQPAVMADGWSHDPFEPQIRDDKLYARGATDDKGQVMIQLKAAESLLKTPGYTCPVNLKYLLEGEEESGSVNLPPFIEAHQDLLAADICLISDTGIESIDQPSMGYGLRGLLSMELIVSGPSRDLHSGTGGILHNPVQALAEIVAQLHHPDGRVAVPGFYDDVATVSDEERAMLNQADMHDDLWQSIMGDLPEWGEDGYTKIERMSIRPTLEINGLAGGYAGAGFKTVIGATGTAKISCRLVPDQDPHRIFEQIKAFIEDITPPTVRVSLTKRDASPGVLTDRHHPAMQAAINAYGYHWQDTDVLLTRIGGSIPIVGTFQSVLNLPVILMGFALPGSQVHGPDEHFYLEMYRRGVDTVITYMQSVTK